MVEAVIEIRLLDLKYVFFVLQALFIATWKHTLTA